MYFDLHTHILYGVDDGATNLKESLLLLKELKTQGITDVLATPHFYPTEDNLDIFKEATNAAFKSLTQAADRHDLPNIYLGCELLFFIGLKNSTSINELCLNKSNFLLLEFTNPCINKDTFNEIKQLRQNTGITPIIAHVERYFKARHFKKFIEFLKEEKIPIQINASSVLIPFFNRTIKKLLNSGLFCVIASDTHSLEMRPPLLSDAFNLIEKKYGAEIKEKLIPIHYEYIE